MSETATVPPWSTCAQLLALAMSTTPPQMRAEWAIVVIGAVKTPSKGVMTGRSGPVVHSFARGILRIDSDDGEGCEMNECMGIASLCGCLKVQGCVHKA